VIDLHLHTTASDGRSTPEELVAEVAAAGCRTIALTDHDTVAGLEATRRAADAAGLAFVDGIEITAVADERDVHILGYFISPADESLGRFLTEQRERRRERLIAMAERLELLGAPVSIDHLVNSTSSGKSLGRPALAQALILAGHAVNVADAFDRFLAEGRPAYVTREGATPAEVIDRIHRAGGLASIAHPGKLGDDDLVGRIAAEGLDAVEVFHPDHEAADQERYGAFASRLGLLVTGGSDYHGPDSGRAGGLGNVSLPAAAFDALARRARDGRA
jgi:predicted metal-dependent phosphoesterase TrpH